ncbi:TonB-dependent receptor [uncultured Shewanella sp.]|uniref:TonB-dependent receptor n=1 Tax=uncultured Shewanella sp. TaxID=173975 RepID=UPI002621FB69|nr:TonB-dependent receptor [uncultured Shewanella sp.]
MNNNPFNRKPLAIWVSLLLSVNVHSISWAEESDHFAIDEPAMEVIEVQGIRSSLIRSMDLKRAESGVVDVISAEDIGKFPDTNLAESLQRITGVTVSRANGEGSQLTIRGFGPEFNLVTLNGRQMPTTGNTRSYNLENLSSDGVNMIEVYKTAKASIPTGGLGGTVNIVTMKPLFSPGQKLSVSAKAIHDTSNEAGNDVTPEYSALYSNTFNDESIGFSFFLTHQKRDFQQQEANIQGWQANVALPDLAADKAIDGRPLDADGNPVGDYFFPRDMNYSIDDLERTKTNGYTVFQYAPIDELILTLDYTGTQAKLTSNSIGWGMWNDYGGNINAYELDANGSAVFTEISGNDGSYSAARSTVEVKEQSFGANIAWAASDSWSFAFDYHDSKSETDNGADPDMGSAGTLVLGSDQLQTKTYDYRRGEVPHSQIYWNNGTTTLAPGEIDSHFSQFLHSTGDASVEQFQLTGTWENTFDIPLVYVQVGMARTLQETSGTDAWSGLIGGFLFNPAWPEMFPDGMFTLNNTDDFLNAFAGGGSDLLPSYYYTFDFDEVVARSEAFLTADVLGDDYFSTSAYRDKGTFTSSAVNEDTDSVFIQSFWEFEWGAFPIQVNMGLRYEETTVTSRVFQDVPTAVWWQGGSEWHTQYEGDSQFIAQGEYDVFLPMIDIKVDVTDDIVARASWGKTISRAPLADLAGGRQLSSSPKIGSREGTEGNANLKPYESTNFDLSLEYYFAEGSYASVGYFKKDVKNFLSSQTVNITIDGLHDIYQGPRWQQAEADINARGEVATNEAIYAQMITNGASVNSQGYIEPTSEDPLINWGITQPFNSDDKQVDGYELAFQYLFGESGFGVGVNGTFVDGDVEFDVTSLEQQSPLTGLGDSANFQMFYEKYDWSIKVAYAWRDKYLLGVGQSQGSSDNPPQFSKAYGQWDMIVNYNISDEFTVFFEGINLNDETEQGYGRYEEQFLFARQYGPRYALGVRYSFN